MHHDAYIHFRQPPKRPPGSGGQEPQEEKTMKDYAAIQEHITRARLERTIFVAELTADAIVATWNGIKYAADVLLTVARTKTRNSVFTFDA
jgi:hypothetical protein